MSNLVLATAGFIYFQLNWLVLNKIDENVSKPYMDEIFHIPQAQQYCAGNYSEWNDKITTLPGLYYLSTSVLRLIALALGENNKNLCTVYNLRLSNLVVSAFNFLVIFKILQKLKIKKPNAKESSDIGLLLLNTLAISLFPLNHFFQYLYYTDTGSTFFVLFAYWQVLNDNYRVSALSAAIAIVFRQTNIIWLMFCMFHLILVNAEHLAKNQEPKKLIRQNSETGIFNVTHQRTKKTSNTFELVLLSPTTAFADFDPIKFLTKLYREDFWGKMLIYQDIQGALHNTKPFILVILKFLVFIYMNNGIVVGDKSNHKATIHLAQLFYFVAFCSIFTVSTFLFSIKKLKDIFNFFMRNSQMIFLVFVPLFFVIVKNFTLEHPFLLADNRHYTFYIWSKFMRKYEWARYLAIPVYLIAFYMIYRNLERSGKSLGWMLAFGICVVTALVPQELIEFRYFIVPFLLYRLNLGQLQWKEALFEMSVNLLINCLTVWIFLTRTFYWENAPEEVQRFMW